MGWVWGLEGRSSWTYQSCEKAWEGEAAAAQGQSSPWARPVCPASWSCPTWNAPENSVCTEREINWRQFTAGRGRRGVTPHNTRHLQSAVRSVPGNDCCLRYCLDPQRKWRCLFIIMSPLSATPLISFTRLSHSPPSSTFLSHILLHVLQDHSLAAAQGWKSPHGLIAWPCDSPESACIPPPFFPDDA